MTRTTTLWIFLGALAALQFGVRCPTGLQAVTKASTLVLATMTGAVVLVRSVDVGVKALITVLSLWLVMPISGHSSDVRSPPPSPTTTCRAFAGCWPTTPRHGACSGVGVTASMSVNPCRASRSSQYERAGPDVWSTACRCPRQAIDADFERQTIYRWVRRPVIEPGRARQDLRELGNDGLQDRP